MKLKEFVEVFITQKEIIDVKEFGIDYVKDLYEGRVDSIPKNLLNWEIANILQSYSYEREEKTLVIFIYNKLQDINSLKVKTDDYEIVCLNAIKGMNGHMNTVASALSILEKENEFLDLLKNEYPQGIEESRLLNIIDTFKHTKYLKKLNITLEEYEKAIEEFEKIFEKYEEPVDDYI